jgi:hypothetical protein
MTRTESLKCIEKGLDKVGRGGVEVQDRTGVSQGYVRVFMITGLGLFCAAYEVPSLVYLYITSAKLSLSFQFILRFFFQRYTTHEIVDNNNY